MYNIYQAGGQKFHNPLCVNSSYQSKEIFNHSSLLAAHQDADKQKIIKLFLFKSKKYLQRICLALKLCSVLRTKEQLLLFVFHKKRKGLITRFWVFPKGGIEDNIAVCCLEITYLFRYTEYEIRLRKYKCVFIVSDLVKCWKLQQRSVDL